MYVLNCHKNTFNIRYILVYDIPICSLNVILRSSTFINFYFIVYYLIIISYYHAYCLFNLQ